MLEGFGSFGRWQRPEALLHNRASVTMACVEACMLVSGVSILSYPGCTLLLPLCVVRSSLVLHFDGLTHQSVHASAWNGPKDAVGPPAAGGP